MAPRIDTAENPWEPFGRWLSQQVARMTERTAHTELDLFPDERQLGIDWEPDLYQVRVHLETQPDDWNDPASIDAARTLQKRLLDAGWVIEEELYKVAALWLISPDTVQDDATEISALVVRTLTEILDIDRPTDLDIEFDSSQVGDAPWRVDAAPGT